MQKMAAAAAVGLIFFAPIVIGQSAGPAFDAASVKENRTPEAGGTLRFMPDGGIRAQGVPVRTLINIAFSLQPYQVVGAPGWSRDLRYDVQAKPAQPVTRDAARAMLQALLIERWRLAFHRERRRLDGYRLIRSSPRALGPSIKRSSFDCEKLMAVEAACRAGGITVDSIKAHGAPIWNLLQAATAVTGAPVSDQTGLTGTYDFELRWCNGLDPCDDRPSFFTALQERLGLRLERQLVDEDVFVVDRLDRPDPD